MEENPYSKYMPHDSGPSQSQDTPPQAASPSATSPSAKDAGGEAGNATPPQAPHRHSAFESHARRSLQLLMPGSTVDADPRDDEERPVWPRGEHAEPGSHRYFWIVLTAQVVSMVFMPFYLPVVAFVALFWLSYLNMLPPYTKVVLTLIVYFFTVLMPHLSIYAYRKLNGWTRHQLGKRERRYVPYVLSITSYAALLYLLYNLHMPRFTLGIIAGALVIQLACALLNSRIKVSTHAAASAGVVGALLAFSLIFNFDPTGWLCFTVLLCGTVCTARLILRQHTLREVGWGVVVGLLSGFCCVLFI